MGEVVKLNYGKAIAKEVRGPIGPVPVYGANGVMDYCEDALADGPSIIVGRKGSAGAINVADGPFWASDVSYFTQHDAKTVDFSFLLYFLQQLDLPSLAKGVKPGINRDEVYALPIPLPPLDEQKRIIAILDEAFEGLSRAHANAEANLADARKIFDAHLDALVAEHVDRFGTISVSELSEEVTDGDHQPPPKAQDGIPFITISNVDKETHQIDFRDTFKVPRAYFAELKDKRKPRSGDVLYTVTGSFGIPILIADDREFCFQRHIALVRPKREISSRWLAFMLMSGSAFKQADEGATGTAQRTVSLKVLRAIQLPKTPPNEQNRFADDLTTLLGDCRSLFDRYRKSIGEVDALRHSLLQKAFSGELTR